MQRLSGRFVTDDISLYFIAVFPPVRSPAPLATWQMGEQLGAAPRSRSARKTLQVRNAGRICTRKRGADTSNL